MMRNILLFSRRRVGVQLHRWKMLRLCRLLDRFRQQSRELFFENLCSSLYSFVGLCFDERRKMKISMPLIY